MHNYVIQNKDQAFSIFQETKDASVYFYELGVADLIRDQFLKFATQDNHLKTLPELIQTMELTWFLIPPSSIMPHSQLFITFVQIYRDIIMQLIDQYYDVNLDQASIYDMIQTFWTAQIEYLQQTESLLLSNDYYPPFEVFSVNAQDSSKRLTQSESFTDMDLLKSEVNLKIQQLGSDRAYQQFQQLVQQVQDRQDLQQGRVLLNILRMISANKRTLNVQTKQPEVIKTQVDSTDQQSTLQQQYQVIMGIQQVAPQNPRDLKDLQLIQTEGKQMISGGTITIQETDGDTTTLQRYDVQLGNSLPSQHYAVGQIQFKHGSEVLQFLQTNRDYDFSKAKFSQWKVNQPVQTQLSYEAWQLDQGFNNQIQVQTIRSEEILDQHLQFQDDVLNFLLKLHQDQSQPAIIKLVQNQLFKIQLNLKNPNFHESKLKFLNEQLQNFNLVHQLYILPQFQPYEQGQMMQTPSVNTNNQLEVKLQYYMFVPNQAALCFILTNLSIPTNYSIIIRQSQTNVWKIKVLAITGRFAYNFTITFLNIGRKLSISYQLDIYNAQQLNHIQGSIINQKLMGQPYEQYYVITMKQLLRIVTYVREQISNDYRRVSRISSYVGSLQPKMYTHTSLQEFILQNQQLPIQLIEGVTFTEFLPSYSGLKATVMDINYHIKLHISLVLLYLQVDYQGSQILQQNLLQFYTQLGKSVNYSEEIIDTIGHFRSRFYYLIWLSLQLQYIDQPDYQKIVAIIFGSYEDAKAFNQYFASTSQIFNSIINEMRNQVDKLDDDTAKLDDIDLVQKAILMPIVDVLAMARDKFGQLIFKDSASTLDENSLQLIYKLDFEQTDSSNVILDVATTKFMYFGQIGDKNLLTAQQVVDYKNKGLWKKMKLQPFNDKQFPQQRRLQVRLSNIDIQTQLLYALIQDIKYEFNIIMRVPAESQVSQFLAAQIAQRFQGNCVIYNSADTTQNLDSVVIDNILSLNPLTADFNDAKPYNNERSFQTQPIRQSTIKAVIQLQQRNQQFLPLVLRLSQVANSYECGSGINSIGLFNRAQSWIKAHQLIVNSYKINYKDNITFKYTKGSNVYYDEQSDNSITKQYIPSNFMTILTDYQLNKSKEFTKFNKPTIQSLFQAYKDYSIGPASASVGFLLNSLRSKALDEESVLSQAMCELTEDLCIDVILDFKKIIAQYPSKSQPQNELIERLFNKRYDVDNRLRSLAKLNQISFQNWCESISDYDSTITIAMFDYLVLSSQYKHNFTIFSDLKGKSFSDQKLWLGYLDIPITYESTKLGSDWVTSQLQQGNISRTQAIYVIQRNFNSRFIRLVQNNSGLSVCVNKLEEYEKIKYQPAPFNKHDRDFFEAEIKAVADFQTRENLSKLAELGDHTKVVTRIVNGVNFFIHHIAACLRDCIKGSILNNDLVISHDMVNADPLSIMYNYLPKYQKGLQNRLVQQKILASVQWQQWSLHNAGKWAKPIHEANTRIEPRYTLINYSDNLYVCTSKGVHMSFDLTKSESGSQQKHTQLMWAWFISILKQQMANKEFQEADQYKMLEKLLAYLTLYASKSCYEMNTIIGNITMQVPGLQSGVPNTFFINHIRSSLLVYFDNFVKPIFQDEFIDYIESKNVHDYIQANQAKDLSMLTCDDCFEGISNFTSDQKFSLKIKIFSQQAAQLCVENSMLWKIEKTTCLCNDCIIQFKEFDTDMLGMQLVKIGKFLLPALDQNRAEKAILFSKDQGLSGLITIVGSALQNSQISQRYSLGQMKTSKFQKLTYLNTTLSSVALLDPFRAQILIRKSATINGVSRPYRDNVLAVFFNRELIAIDIMDGYDLDSQKDKKLYRQYIELLECLVHIIDFSKLYALQYFVQGQPSLQLLLQQMLMNKAAYFFALEDWIKSKVGILNFDDEKLAKEMQKNSEGLVSVSIGQQAFQQLPQIFKQRNITMPSPHQIAAVLLHVSFQTDAVKQIARVLRVQQDFFQGQFNTPVLDVQDEESDDFKSLMDPSDLSNEFVKLDQIRYDHLQHSIQSEQLTDLSIVQALPKNWSSNSVKLRPEEFLKWNTVLSVSFLVFNGLQRQYDRVAPSVISFENHARITFAKIPMVYNLLRVFCPTSIPIFFFQGNSMYSYLIPRSVILDSKGVIEVDKDESQRINYQQYVELINNLKQYIIARIKHSGQYEAQFGQIIIGHFISIVMPWLYRMQAILTTDQFISQQLSLNEDNSERITFGVFSDVTRLVMLNFYFEKMLKLGYDLKQTLLDVYKMYKEWQIKWFQTSSIQQKLTLIVSKSLLFDILSESLKKKG